MPVEEQLYDPRKPPPGWGSNFPGGSPDPGPFTTSPSVPEGESMPYEPAPYDGPKTFSIAAQEVTDPNTGTTVAFGYHEDATGTVWMRVTTPGYTFPTTKEGIPIPGKITTILFDRDGEMVSKTSHAVAVDHGVAAVADDPNRYMDDPNVAWTKDAITPQGLPSEAERYRG